MPRQAYRRSLKIRGRGAVPQRRLSPHDELAVALHTIDDFGRSIQIADAKAGMLTAALGLVTGGAASNLGGADAGPLLAAPSHAGVPFVAFWVFLVSLLVAGVALGMTQLPRLNATVEACRLAFPSAARWGCRPTAPTVVELRDEAWRQAEILASIAMRKFHHLRIALLATGVCILAFLCWLITSASLA